MEQLERIGPSCYQNADGSFDFTKPDPEPIEGVAILGALRRPEADDYVLHPYCGFGRVVGIASGGVAVGWFGPEHQEGGVYDGGCLAVSVGHDADGHDAEIELGTFPPGWSREFVAAEIDRLRPPPPSPFGTPFKPQPTSPPAPAAAVAPAAPIEPLAAEPAGTLAETTAESPPAAEDAASDGPADTETDTAEELPPGLVLGGWRFERADGLTDGDVQDDFDEIAFLHRSEWPFSHEEWELYRRHRAAPELTAAHRRAVQAEKVRRAGERQRVLEQRHAAMSLLSSLGFIVGVAQGDGLCALTVFVVTPDVAAADAAAFRKFTGYEATGMDEPASVASVLRFAGTRAFIRFEPAAGEYPGACLARHAIKAETLAENAEWWRAAGGNPRNFERMREFQRPARERDGARFIVRGLIPAREITLFVGPKKTGKTTLMMELATVIARGGGTWCGFDVPPDACDGTVALVFGEDNKWKVGAIMQQMDPAPGSRALKVAPFCRDGRPLSEIIADIMDYENVRLVVIDPARKYLAGNEDDSGVVSEFFTALETLCEGTGCAVVVIHHPRKDGGKFRTLAEVYNAARGSGVFLDRPRNAVAALRRGDRTVIGIPNVNGSPMHNMPPSYGMFEGERELLRDPATMRHVPADMAPPADRRSEPPADADQRRVLAAIRRLASEGVRVSKTGPNGLFKLSPPELAGMSRARIEATADELLAAGLIVNAPDGLRPA